MNDVIEADVPIVTQEVFTVTDADPDLARQWWERESAANTEQIRSIHNRLDALGSGNHDPNLDDLLDALESQHATLYEQSGLLNAGDLQTIRRLAEYERRRIEQDKLRNRNHSTTNSD